MVFTSTWSSIAASQTNAGSPLDSPLMDGIRQDIDVLKEWVGKDYFAGRTTDHNHDGVNSAALAQIGVAGLNLSSAADSGTVAASNSVNINTSRYFHIDRTMSKQGGAITAGTLTISLKASTALSTGISIRNLVSTASSYAITWDVHVTT